MMEGFQQLEILETVFQVAQVTCTKTLTFLSSLEELASFVNLKNVRTLLMVTETFWQLCQPLNEEFWETKRRPTHPIIYSLIDSTKDWYHFYALCFE
ncbi:MAG: hypothetical protein EXX96DRAFT_645903 [Benjaminiella poitrasii]|nr:MAG: hypothetical protein EXX96DRAFT_645903 [Benjaminiella poitrasii]